MSTNIQEQIERRRERAREEILKIANKGSHPVFSLFEVKSVSGRVYRVEIRSLDELQNSCTCPDYKSNLIDTCKHIEGVLIHLRAEHGDKLEKLAAERPRGAQIYLHYGAEVTVRVSLPLPDPAAVTALLTRYFDASGALMSEPLQTLPSLFAAVEALPARECPLIIIAQGVREYLALLQDREEVAQQKEWFLDQVQRERLLMYLVKMRLICNALALHDKEIPLLESEKTGPKLGELVEILDEEIASNGHKAVVFSQWATMLALTEPIIQRVGLGYVKLTGDVLSAKRGDLIQEFFDNLDCRVFLSTDAGGVGLNLQAASLVINLDLPWNPAVLEQCIARAHRHGQPSSVQVINLVAKDTIEERMLDTLAAKKNVFASVFGTDECRTGRSGHRQTSRGR